PMADAKKEMRRQMDARLALLSPEEVVDHSRRLCERLLSGGLLDQVEHVALYAAFGCEIDLTLVATACHERGMTLWYPRFSRELRRYELALIGDPGTDLVPGHWGLLEPGAEAPLVGDEVKENNLVWLV